MSENPSNIIGLLGQSLVSTIVTVSIPVTFTCAYTSLALPGTGPYFLPIHHFPIVFTSFLIQPRVLDPSYYHLTSILSLHPPGKNHNSDST